MNVNQISMDKEAAKAKYAACISENHADSFEFNQACAKAYEHLAAGTKLLSLSRSIQQAGLHEDGRPKLAIARADRKEVYFQWRGHNTVATFNCEANPTSWSAGRWPDLIRHVEMGRPLSKDWSVCKSGWALIPGVPADERPKVGQLKDWWVLWEVDQWADRRFGPAPADPILLEHIGGDLYAVLAQWDLTEVERIVLEELNT